jgi:hypothetical protein
MIELLRELKKKCVIGYVGGSDLAKQKEQLGEDAATHLFDFGFSENGATAFKNGQQIGSEVPQFQFTSISIFLWLELYRLFRGGKVQKSG